MSKKDWKTLRAEDGMRIWKLTSSSFPNVVHLVCHELTWHLLRAGTTLATFPYLENPDPPFRQAEYILALNGFLPKHITLETDDE